MFSRTRSRFRHRASSSRLRSDGSVARCASVIDARCGWAAGRGCIGLVGTELDRRSSTRPDHRGAAHRPVRRERPDGRELAAALGTTTTRVTAALRRHGIPRRPEPPAPPPPLGLDGATLTELYVTRRLDDTAIGTRYGVPAWRVTMRRRELGVHRPTASAAAPGPPVMPPAADLHRWYVIEGRTLEQIARHASHLPGHRPRHGCRPPGFRSNPEPAGSTASTWTRC